MYLGVSLFIPSAKISLIRLFNGSIRLDVSAAVRILYKSIIFGLVVVSNMD
jgi:hypothetical protein